MSTEAGGLIDESGGEGRVGGEKGGAPDPVVVVIIMRLGLDSCCRLMPLGMGGLQG